MARVKQTGGAQQTREKVKRVQELFFCSPSGQVGVIITSVTLEECKSPHGSSTPIVSRRGLGNSYTRLEAGDPLITAYSQGSV